MLPLEKKTLHCEKKIFLLLLQKRPLYVVLEKTIFCCFFKIVNCTGTFEGNNAENVGELYSKVSLW